MANSLRLAILIVFFSWGFSCGPDKEVNKEVFQDNQTEQNKVNKLLFGQSASYMFEADPNPSKLVLDKIGNLSAPFLRFPGGTESNFYHFYGKGNGFAAEDIELSIGHNVHSKMTRRLKRQEKQIKSGKFDRNFASNFVRVCKEVDASAVLVMNLFSGSDDENLDLIRYVKEQGVNIIGIELGNENYFRGFDEVFPDAKEYIRRAQTLTQKIKELDADLKVAITAANPPFDSPLSLRPRFSDWNKEIAKYNFYDAVIIHFYPKTNECDEMLNKDDRFICAFETSLDNKESMFSEGLDYYRGLFGQNAKFWITEYNVKNVFEHYGNSNLQALYAANFIFTLLDESQIDLAIYHNLFSNSYGYAMLSRNKKDAYERIPYFSFELFAELNESYQLQDFSIELPEGIQLKLFYSPENNEHLCYVINNLEKARSISFGSFGDGMALRHKGFYSDKLSSSLGRNPFSDDEINKGVYFFDQEGSSSSIDIPAYSFSLISF